MLVESGAMLPSEGMPLMKQCNWMKWMMQDIDMDDGPKYIKRLSVEVMSR